MIRVVSFRKAALAGAAGAVAWEAVLRPPRTAAAEAPGTLWRPRRPTI